MVNYFLFNKDCDSSYGIDEAYEYYTIELNKRYYDRELKDIIKIISCMITNWSLLNKK